MEMSILMLGCKGLIKCLIAFKCCQNLTVIQSFYGCYFFLCTVSLQFIRDEKNSITLLSILYCDQGLTTFVISNLQMKLRTK